ncbi:MAG: ATP-binding protein [Luteolibacter sp.]
MRQLRESPLLGSPDSSASISHAIFPHLGATHHPSPEGRRSDGIRLGLAIVRRIVEAHHGNIEVASEPGRGSLFRIHFPIES